MDIEAEAAKMQSKLGGLTKKNLALALNVSERAIYYAGVVERHGIRELGDAILAGKVSNLAQAAELAKQPAELQRKALADVLEGRAKTLKAAMGIQQPSNYDKLVKAWNACSEDEQGRFIVTFRQLVADMGDEQE